MDFDLISADDHLDLNYLPRDLWETRLPQKWRSSAPRVETTDEGPSWVCEGQRLGFYGSRRGTFLPTFDRAGVPEEPEPDLYRPASSHYRLQDMDRDGVHAQVIYGPPAHLPFEDLELKTACLRVYNTWLAQEFCDAAPHRLLGIALLPVHDSSACVAELRHAAELGLRGAVFDVYRAVEPVFSPIWEELWSCAEETGVVISFHTGGGMYSLRARPGSFEMMATVSILPLQLDEAISGLIFCGALERHPGLRIVVAEVGLGWLPYLLGRMDATHHRYYDSVRDHRLSSLPSEIFRRQMYVSFEDDPIGVAAIEAIGAENVMWASDYPHGDTTFPDSRGAVERFFEGADPGLLRRVARDNAARLYGIE